MAEKWQCCKNFSTFFADCLELHKIFLPLHPQTAREFSSAGSEHLPYKQRVGGSNPSTPTKRKASFWDAFFVCGSFSPKYIHIPSPYPSLWQREGFLFRNCPAASDTERRQAEQTFEVCGVANPLPTIFTFPPHAPLLAKGGILFYTYRPASFTKYSNNPKNSSSPAATNASGWNCTPKIGLPFSISIASTTPSSATAVTTNPGARSLTDW